MGMDSEARQLAADMADDFRPYVQAELMKSRRRGVSEGLAIAERMAEGLRVVAGDEASETLEALILAVRMEREKLG